MARVEGQVVKVGDTVCFKSDYEQCGRITKINGDMLTLESTHEEGFGGDYIGGQMTTVQSASSCWIE